MRLLFAFKFGIEYSTVLKFFNENFVKFAAGFDGKFGSTVRTEKFENDIYKFKFT